MKTAAAIDPESTDSINTLPVWATPKNLDSPETAAFSAGAALAILDLVLKNRTRELPSDLLRDRLALKAAVACLKLEGRNESVADIRDAACLTRAGDSPGPAGEVFILWRKVSQIRLNTFDWSDRLMRILPKDMGGLIVDTQRLNAQASFSIIEVAEVLAESLKGFPREETASLVLADVFLAQHLGWRYPVPLLAGNITPKKIREIVTGKADPSAAVLTSLILACDTAVRTASDLTRRANKLRDVAPKLRARGAKEGVELFLTKDALSPSGALSQGRGAMPVLKGEAYPMTDRAARRFCDRLVDLGVIHELTGRTTFRLYGL